MKSHFFLVFFLVFIAACTQKTNTDSLTSTINKTALSDDLKSIVDSFQLMGMSVAVVENGAIAYEGYFGQADSIRQIPINQKTKYRIASISKVFTATALLQLWEQGKVDFDTDVSEYLGWLLRHPKFPETPITLRLLLSHRSGMTDGSKYYPFAADMVEKDLPITELFTPEGAYYTEDLFLDHQPGSYFSYANCTWSIIATIIEKISGERFDRYCRQHIFEPLGMSASFDPRDISNIDDLAILYRVYANGSWKPQKDSTRGKRPPFLAKENYLPGTNGLLFSPQGGLRASAQDLAIFALVLMNEGQLGGQQILQAKTVELMCTKQWSYDGTNGNTWDNFLLSYGLGMHLCTNQDSADIVVPGRPMFGHAGIAYGLLSDMYIDKEKKRAIIFITNGSKFPFARGKRSSFYRVEEEVFAKVNTHFNW